MFRSSQIVANRSKAGVIFFACVRLVLVQPPHPARRGSLLLLFRYCPAWPIGLRIISYQQRPSVHQLYQQPLETRPQKTPIRLFFVVTVHSTRPQRLSFHQESTVQLPTDYSTASFFLIKNPSHTMAPTTHDQHFTPSSDSNTPTESHNIGAPAFLDLADSVCISQTSSRHGLLIL